MRSMLRSKANSIEGGTSEINLNIVAKRVSVCQTPSSSPRFRPRANAVLWVPLPPTTFLRSSRRRASFCGFCQMTRCDHEKHQVAKRTADPTIGAL